MAKYNDLEARLDAKYGGNGGLILGLSFCGVALVAGLAIKCLCCKKDAGEMSKDNMEGGYARQSLLVQIEEA